MPCASAKSRSVEPPRSSARASVPRSAASSRAARGRLMRSPRRARVDAGLEQGFAGVDVAGADDDVTRQQHGLDRRAPAPQRGVEGLWRERRSKGSAPRRASSVAAGAWSSAATRPRRRSDAGRSGAGAAVGDEVEVVVRPRFAGLRPQPSDPDMPRCSSRPPRAAVVVCRGSHRYLPRRATSPTVQPASACGVTPSGQRKGLPSRAASTTAPRSGPAMPRRVTSTSGSSGMDHYVRMILQFLEPRCHAAVGAMRWRLLALHVGGLGAQTAPTLPPAPADADARRKQLGAGWPAASSSC
jgi:hypothetical protein